jgi:hypothetical protein
LGYEIPCAGQETLAAASWASIQSTEDARCGLKNDCEAEKRQPSSLEDCVHAIREDEVETVAGKRNGERYARE